MYNILFYGDSNTWGYDPSCGLRYAYEKRWTSVCAGLLGEGYNCIPAGMNGRTTAFDDPEKPLRNGCKEIDHELQSQKPLDLVVIMLGTNDMKYIDAKGCADGMEQLIRMVLDVNERFSVSSPVFMDTPSVLIVSPVHLKSSYGTSGYDDIAESRQLAGYYEKLADQYGLFFMDAARYAEASDIDGEHLTEEAHQVLGKAVAEKIMEIAGDIK
ncbi:MAG: hypothetical protein E7236_07415 [Lachnospiraceae bacterium]|nr:hypothetical protein [Lachnospiraceae bacterium]